MKIWKDDEVKNLFNEVEKCKKQNRPLREAFSQHAKNYGRKANSVRNYYYADVENLANDIERAGRLGVKISDHEKKHFTAFDKAEEEELFEKIKEKVESGMSVRSACMSLSGGNLTEMTRIQNKYQNMLRKLHKTNNVVQFRQNSVTESEINSLFLGLVKLIKKNALEEANRQAQISNQNLKDLESEVLRLRHENILLKKENEMLNAQMFDKKASLEKHFERNAEAKLDNMQKEFDKSPSK